MPEDPSVRELSLRGPEALRLPVEPDTADVDAAVAVVMRPGPAGWEVLLCRRAEREGDPWSGHISLPGGRVEAGDPTAAETARRETIEEVGLDPLDAGRLLGAFGPIAGRGSSATTRIAVAVFAVPERTPAGTSDEIVESWWTPFRDLETVTVAIAALGVDRPAFALVSPGGGTAIVWGLTHHVFRVLHSLSPPAAARTDEADG